MNTLDADKNGVISKQEFQTALKNVTSQMKKEIKEGLDQ
jgi:Ca2+-binding EF-hand superfamily protein